MPYQATRDGHALGYVREACYLPPPREDPLSRHGPGGLFLLLGLGVPRVGAWDGKTNTKAADDLARMGAAELCTEAVAVCLHSAQPGTGMAMEGLDYLAVIRQAAQKKYGETVPSWLEEVATAIAKHDPLCEGERSIPLEPGEVLACFRLSSLTPPAATTE
jgi:hypothetical protein